MTVDELRRARAAFRKAMPKRAGSYRYCEKGQGYHDDDSDDIAWTQCDDCLNTALRAALACAPREGVPRP